MQSSDEHHANRELGAERTTGRWDRQGSAIVLVLLILLALSAIGMIALQDVTRSVEQSGQFRVRSTASMFADGVGMFISKRVGDKASQYWKMMEKFQEFDMESGGGTMGGREDMMTRGAYVKLQQYPSDSSKQDFSKLFGVSSSLSGDETGLFVASGSTNRSFESRQNGTRFDIVIRDPIDGIPVPGYSDKYCFKKVTLAAKTRLGNIDQDWSKPRQVAVGRTVADGLIGPIECGSD